VSRPFGPERWANEISILLNAAYGADRFPVHVPTLAKDYSHQRFPDDPILKVVGGDLPGFEGALYRAPTARAGWGIIYNRQVRSHGRINFTLAHELGHYLLHREAYPEGIECGEQDVVRWDSEYGQVEHQANLFAASLLMPLDDFRRQIPSRAVPTLDMLAHCADRYRVSLVASVLRWLSYTERRAILVVSRDGFILWARSSERALLTGAYFRTSIGPIEIPAAAGPNQLGALDDGRGEFEHEAGVWLSEPAQEITLVAEQYDFSLSLLLLGDAPAFEPRAYQAPRTAAERFTANKRGQTLR
jgi:hypothetical protein